MINSAGIRCIYRQEERVWLSPDVVRKVTILSVLTTVREWLQMMKVERLLIVSAPAMPRHLLDNPNLHDDYVELTPEEANNRWERLRIAPCEECSEQASGIRNEDVIIYHETR